MTNLGLKYFCESLTTSPFVNLQYLRIHWNSITATGMKSLALTISLGVLDSLHVLDLSSNSLRLFITSENSIGEKGIAVITESVIRGNHLQHLQVLLLYCNHMIELSLDSMPFGN